MGNFSLTHNRIRALILMTAVIMFFFGLRLVQVQAVQASDYRSRAVNEMEKVKTLQAPRGDITDINGVPFARSVAATSIVVDQTQILNPAKVAAFVAPILNMSVSDVQIAITGKRKWSMVAENAKPATWLKLTKAIEQYNSNFPGMSPERIIGFFPERSYVREYPSGSLIASLIGFVNKGGVGATGLESSMNSIIAGTDGKYSYANGYKAEIPGSQSEIVSAEAGTSIRLTIDRDIQWVASKAIADAVKSSNAISGTVIVMDPRTGHILAHATAPTFDPNNTSKVSLVAMRNPSVQDVYEPGSTGKVMTLAAALEEGKITPETVFTVPYALKRSDKTFHDHERHPDQRLTASGILAVSSNTGSIQIGETMPNDVLHNYLSKFGIGEKTGSGLPGESRGILPKVGDWSGTTAPTVAFGQGYSLTAMQATSVFATIANDGVRVSPTVIAGTSDASGNYTPSATRESVRVISADTARKMRIMMESVVSGNGTAPSAAIEGYRVAGKTGTAQRIDDTCGCYRGYTASFIGFAPADNPAYVISVTIQDPKGMHWGGVLGGPVFKDVMSFVLKSKGIAPTGTKIDPVALTEKQLIEAKKLAAKKAANAKAN
ncbi:MAG: penicillin-binding protein 2 [Candidatus Planktophila sp.]|nr:penicillin-binding protein 2 [Candidatus Planktophila sp.]